MKKCKNFTFLEILKNQQWNRKRLKKINKCKKNSRVNFMKLIDYISS